MIDKGSAFIVERYRLKKKKHESKRLRDSIYYNLLINSVNDTKIVKVLVGYEASSKKYWKNSFTLRAVALTKLF